MKRKIIIISIIIAAVLAITVFANSKLFKDMIHPETGEITSGEEIEQSFRNAAERIAEISDKSKIIAKVNGENITNNDLILEIAGSSLSDRNDPKTDKEYLQKIINEKIIDQEAKKYGVSLTDEEIEQMLENEYEVFDRDEQENNEIVSILGITKEELCLFTVNNGVNAKNRLKLWLHVFPLIRSGEMVLNDENAGTLLEKISNGANDPGLASYTKELQQIYEAELISSADVEIIDPSFVD